MLFPETAGKTLRLINTQSEKIELLEETGLDNMVIIPFTKEFSELSSFDFIRKILVGKLHARTIVVGFNHHFGHNHEGGFEELFALGKFHDFTVEEIPQQDIENETVSSTRIRKAIQEGKIQRANAYLDHYYMIIGLLVPTEHADAFKIKIEETCKLIPMPGYYAVSVIQNQESSKALLCIENEGSIRLITTTQQLIPDEMARVYFHKQIREGLNQINSTISFQNLKNEIEELIY